MRDDILRGEPRSLARFFSLDDEPHSRWTSAELSSILRHQLRSPLLFDLRGIIGDADDGRSDDSLKSEIRSFADLLSHPDPPIALLRLTKEFANASDARVAEPLPREIATVLYFASIVAALLRHELRISSLTANELQSGVNWSIRQPWLDTETRALFEEARTSIDFNRLSG